MRMKMNTSLSGPTVNVAPGGVHVCSPAEAIRHYRAGHGVPTEDCVEEFTAALAEQEASEEEIAAAAASAASVLDAKDEQLEPAQIPAPDIALAPIPAPVATKADKPAKTTPAAKRGV